MPCMPTLFVPIDSLPSCVQEDQVILPNFSQVNHLWTVSNISIDLRVFLKPQTGSRLLSSKLQLGPGKRQIDV